MAKCITCQQEYPSERQAAGYNNCIGCSREERVAGAMIYGHKTGATLEIGSKADVARHRKVTARKGQKSILRQMSPGGGRLQ